MRAWRRAAAAGGGGVLGQESQLPAVMYCRMLGTAFAIPLKWNAGRGEAVWRQCNDCIRVKSSPFRTAVCRTGAHSLPSACLCYAFVALPHHHPQPGRGDLRAERSVSGGRALARGSAANQPGWPQSRRARRGSWCPQTILYSQPDLKGLRMAAPAGLPVDEAFELSFSPSHSAGDQVHGGKGRLPQSGCAHCSDAAAAARPPATGAGAVRRLALPLAHPCPPRSRPATATAPPPAAPHASLASRQSSGRRQTSCPPRTPLRVACCVSPLRYIAKIPACLLKGALLPWIQAPGVKQSAKQVNARLMQTQAPQVGAGPLAPRHGC